MATMPMSCLKPEATQAQVLANEDTFNHSHATLMQHLGVIAKPYQRHNQPINLWLLYKLVCQAGGALKVTEQKLWKAIGEAMGYRNWNNISAILKQQYNEFLYSYEQMYVHGYMGPFVRPVVEKRKRSSDSGSSSAEEGARASNRRRVGGAGPGGPVKPMTMLLPGAQFSATVQGINVYHTTFMTLQTPDPRHAKAAFCTGPSPSSEHVRQERSRLPASVPLPLPPLLQAFVLPPPPPLQQHCTASAQQGTAPQPGTACVAPCAWQQQWGVPPSTQLQRHMPCPGQLPVWGTPAPQGSPGPAPVWGAPSPSSSVGQAPLRATPLRQGSPCASAGGSSQASSNISSCSDEALMPWELFPVHTTAEGRAGAGKAWWLDEAAAAVGAEDNEPWCEYTAEQAGVESAAAAECAGKELYSGELGPEAFEGFEDLLSLVLEEGDEDEDEGEEEEEVM